MVDPARPEPPLGNLEAPAAAEDDIALRHPHIMEADVHMAMRRVVVAEDAHGADDLDARGVQGHENLRLAVVPRRAGVGHHHDDHDLATRVAGAGDVELLAVDHPFAAVEHRCSGDVGGVGGGHGGLGHGESRADFAGEQRREPPLLLFLGAETLEHFHVAGVRGAAIHRLRGEPAAAHDFSEVRVFEIADAGSALAFGQEKVPQALVPSFLFQAIEDFILPRRMRPALAHIDLGEIFPLQRLDLVADEAADFFADFDQIFGQSQIHDVFSCASKYALT